MLWTRLLVRAGILLEKQGQIRTHLRGLDILANCIYEMIQTSRKDLRSLFSGIASLVYNYGFYVNIPTNRDGFYCQTTSRAKSSAYSTWHSMTYCLWNCVSPVKVLAVYYPVILNGKSKG